MAVYARAPSKFKNKIDYVDFTPDKMYQIVDDDGIMFTIYSDDDQARLRYWSEGWKLFTSSPESVEKLNDPTCNNVYFTVVDLGDGPFVGFFDSEESIQVLGDSAYDWEDSGGVLVNIPTDIIPTDLLINFKDAQQLLKDE